MRVVEGVASVDDVEAFVGRLGAIGDEHGVLVQALDARYVVDRTHLETAVRLATRAFDRGDAIADDPAVEILCYAAGRRQINRAMTMGVGVGEVPVVVVVDGGLDDDAAGEWGATDAAAEEAAAAAAIQDLLEPASTLGAYDAERVREFFDVADPELAAADGDLPGIVRERVALLVVEK
jgi:KEOPS complex subunit Cgi121